MIPLIGYSQPTSFVDNFNDNELATHWQFGDMVYSGVEEDSVLRVSYNRTSSSGAWEQFHINLPDLNISDHPYLTFRIKSDVQINLAVKPENRETLSDWLEQSISGDREWQEVFFEILNATNNLNKIYFYFDGGSTFAKAGTVSLDDIRIGSAVEMPITTYYLEEAVFDANNLDIFSIEGVAAGQYPVGSKAILRQFIEAAQSFLEQPELITSQDQVDSMTNLLYDRCTQFEIKVNHDFNYDMSDDSLIYGALNLYSNLHALNGSRFMYGMHDATGYGVGWNGDDDRSDVEDVTGSLPAFFSWELNAITRKKSIDRFSYRVENAHRLGGVNSMVWHQYDPLGEGFYATEVEAPDSIAASLLPGGFNHVYFKEKLKTIGHYFKSIRDDQGQTIPVLFRPFHEHNGWWFWWGSLTTPEETFIELWRFTADYLKDSMNVHNLLYVYSPDGHRIDTTMTYLYGYPGDDYVDVLALDYYFGNGTAFEIERLRTHLHTAVQLAQERDKVAAVSEIGDRKNWDNIDALEIDNWHMDVVLKPIKEDSLSQKIAYLSTWRNESTTHHFAPYPGHKAVLDFLEFYGDTTTIFLNNMVKGITDSTYTDKLNELSDAAHIFSYKIQDTIAGLIEGSEITIDGSFAEGIKFTPDYGSSMNATVEVNGDEQMSGKSIVSLAAPTWYTITSENLQVTRDYLVTLQNMSTANAHIEQDNPLDIYPLPARSILHVQSGEEILKVEIYDMNGKAIRKFTGLNPNKLSLHLDGLIPADYVFQFYLANQKIQSRIITVH